MGSGILSGAFWGLIVSALALAVASLLAEQPPGTAPPAAPQTDAPEVTGSTPGEEGSDAGDPIDPSVGPAQPETPSVPTPEGAPAMPEADTAPPDAPEAGTVEDSLAEPSEGTAPAVTAAEEQPVLPSPQTPPPRLPESESDLTVSTAPADPPEADEAPAVVVVDEAGPEIVVVEDADGGPDGPDSGNAATGDSAPDLPATETPQEPDPADGITVADGPSPSPDAPDVGTAPPAAGLERAAGEDGENIPTAPGSDMAAVEDPDIAEDAPAAPDPGLAAVEAPATGEDAGAAPAAAGDSAPVVADAAPSLSPAAPGDRSADVTGSTPAAPQDPDAPAADPATDAGDRPVVADAAPAITPTAPAAADSAVRSAAEDSTPDSAPPPEMVVIEEAERTPDLPEADTGGLSAEANTQAETSRLPSFESGVTVNRPGAIPDVPEPDAAPAPEVAEIVEGPALSTYASAFENPDGRALMSVVLIDDGALDGAPALIAGLPFPATVALAPGMPGAAERAAAYRAAGVEIAALADLPAGARPQDVEVTLEAVSADLPEALALIDPGTGALQGDRDVAQQAMSALAEAGMGLVSASEGLNTAVRAAERAEVPAAAVYRDLDSEGQDARVIRRFLDQAAFRARQQSGVVLLARVRPDTISALILWAQANRSGDVLLAPVSAVLTAAE